MKKAQLSVQYVDVNVSGKLIESPRLFNDEELLRQNEQLAGGFIEKLMRGEFSNSDKSISFYGVKAGDVAAFIKNFKSLDWNQYYDTESLSSFIRENDEVWNVFVIKGANHEHDWKINSQQGVITVS